MPRRSFVVFDSSDNAAADCLRLIGRVVLDPRRPLDGYRPKTNSLMGASGEAPPNLPTPDDADAFLSEFRLKTVTDTNTTIRAELVKSVRAQFAFTKLISASPNVGQSSQRILKAKSMQTFALEQHGDVYDALIAQYGADLETLMGKQVEGRPLYLMVTLKTARDLRVFNTDEEHYDSAAKGEPPIGDLVPTGRVPPETDPVTVSIMEEGIEKNKTREEALELVAVDERGIAAEYCEIERTPKVRFRLRPARGIENPKLRFKNEMSIFSGEHLSFNGEEKDQTARKEDEFDDEYT